MSLLNDQIETMSVNQKMVIVTFIIGFLAENGYTEDRHLRKELSGWISNIQNMIDKDLNMSFSTGMARRDS